MILYDYEYDLISHPYLSEWLDEDRRETVQSIRLPAGFKALTGFRVKLAKTGNPGPLRCRIGLTPGGAEIWQGEISPEAVTPAFELMVGQDFPPVTVPESGTLYIALKATGGKAPLDAYKLFGPNTGIDFGGPESVLLPYWWWQKWEATDDLDYPIPADYTGAALPGNPYGERLPDGGPAWSFSFCLLTEGDAKPDPAVELRFEFVRRLMAPPFAEWKNLRDANFDPSPGEVVVESGWGLELEGPRPAAAENALLELQAFLERVMAVRLGPPGRPRLTLKLAPEASLPDGNESFMVTADGAGISLSARQARGLLAGVHWLEDQFTLRRGPALPQGLYRVRLKHATRMAPGIYPAPAYYSLREAQIWNRGYLWRMARAGYNAIYLPVNVEELVEHSAVFPEMDDPLAPVEIERLRRLVNLAAEFGIDVYLDLKTGYCKPFSEQVYQRLPHLRSYGRFGNTPCSGQPETRDFYRETLANVFTKVEGLKGVIVIYDTEGFFSCFIHNLQHKCPYCKDYSPEDLASRLFVALQAGIHARRNDTELVLWSYFCDEPWNYAVMRAMPPDAVLMACFSQFKQLDRFGVGIRTDDYSLCAAGPSEYFLKVEQVAKEKGLRFFCKTEDTFGQEFVSTPYTPCLEQHQRRWDELNRHGLDGFLSQYVHLGFMDTPCADLMRLNEYEAVRDAQRVELPPAEKLRRVAVQRYGEAPAASVVQAWTEFSAAIRDYFPYTWGVCRYPGPLQAIFGQPYFLDPARKVPRLRSRGYVRDLKWTAIDPRFLVDPQAVWNAALVSRCFQALRGGYRAGLEKLEDTRTVCPPETLPALEELWQVARVQYLQACSILNLIQFFQLRERYLRARESWALEALIYSCEAEKVSVTEALRLCEADSRIGFSCEGAGNVRGGLFTPLAIHQKLAGLQETLEALYELRN